MRTSEEDGVLEAARAIRPYLTELLGPSAPALDRRIAEELNGATNERERVIAVLRELLEGHEDTRWFLAEVLDDAPHYRPPYQQPRHRRRSAEGMPSPYGDPSPILATVYTCPQGDYTWYEPEIGTPVPACPTPGHAQLVKATGHAAQADAGD